MKFDKRQAAPRTNEHHDLANLTDANYVDAMIAYVQRNGSQFVIRNENSRDDGEKTPAQWKAWVNWFSAHKIGTAAKELHGIVTVSTEWPEQFDITAEMSNRSYRFPWRAPNEELTAEERYQVTHGGRNVAAKMEFPVTPRRPDWKEPKETPEQECERKMAESAATPLRASSGLLKAMGRDVVASHGREPV